MALNDGVRIRRSINAIYRDYLNGEVQELTDLIRAWKGISDISQKDPNAWNSFFKIGGMHGEPFRGAGYANAAWWGGYCHHGNVLFPTWHRAYCFHIENALRSIPGCSNVTLPYWDETGEETEVNGVPEIFLQPKFTLDGTSIDNPLYSYTFPQNIVDRVDQDPTNLATYNLYTKLKGYKTVRYPYSGLVGTDEVKAATEQHNAQFSPQEAAELLSANVRNWLNAGITVDGKFIPTGTRMKFENCLHAPNYTVFSNTTSAQAWNDDASSAEHVVPLESPHNDIHLAVGGFQVEGQGNFSPIPGANGDMGENDTAGLDPIFFFHHCEIDRYFWLWQQKNNSTTNLELIPEYPGTNSVDNQGPTPGIAGGTWLTLDTELQPFTKPSESGPPIYLTSRDVIDTTALGYTYDTPGRGFLGKLPPPQRAEASVRIGGVHKNSIAGSHQLKVYATLPGENERKLVAVESVLSRWHVSGCANCQLTGDVQRYAPLHGISSDDVEKGNVKLDVELVTREGSGTNLGDKLGKKQPKPSWEVFGKGKKLLG